MKSSSVAEPGAGARHKRGGRKTKTAWRKNVDIEDVEEFLEDQRLDERLGRVSDKSDGELFEVDRAGDAALQDAVDNSQRAPRVSSKSAKRAALASTVPRCYQTLEPTSQVKDPNSKRNTLRPAGNRPGDLSRLSAARRAKSDERARRQQQAQQDTLRHKQDKRRTRASRSTFATDAWQAESTGTLPTEWLDEEGVRHNERPAARPPPRREPLRPAPPALPHPHPGQSYNPSYEDHQQLLRAVCEKEQLLMKKEKHLTRVTTALYKTLRPDQAKSEWLKEMMSGLPESVSLTPAPPSASAAPASDSDGEYKAINPPVVNKKKDSKARRKQVEQRQQLQERERRKIDKKKIADLYKLRFLERSLAATEARLTRARGLRAERRRTRLASAPPSLNSHKHKPLGEDFQAPHELAPALRVTSHAGNLLRDRFESFKRRGVLAPSRIFLRKKLRLKRFWKPGHKVTPKDIAAHTPAAAPARARNNKTV